jgi:amino acid adenylation domain-containing protein
MADTNQSLVHRFEQQVERHGHRLAVKTRQQQATYDALNRLANRVAWAVLSARGPSQEPVALLMEKEVACFAALLGILKSGNIYVPLPSTNPVARNALLLEDAGTAVLVTDRAHAAAAAELAAGRNITVLNVEEPEIDFQETNPRVPLYPDDDVYILYTSGTTGRPKGVVTTHRNLLVNICNNSNVQFLGCEDRITCFGAVPYSGSLKYIFGALLNGACLYPLDLQKDDLAGLWAWLAAERITVVDSVPTIFRSLVNSLTGTEDLGALRIVRLGGEAVSHKDVALFRQHFPTSCVLLNGYGPTEGGTNSVFVIDHDTKLPSEGVPLGEALDGCEVLLLDEAGGEVEGEGIGQIALRCDYLARGYWQRPEQTRAVFREDPLGGPRTYLTGDVAQRLADGALVFAGRVDSQVKIRGHRVELAEIERKLLDLKQIKEAAVLPRPELRQDHCLVAYVVPEPGTSAALSADHLRRHLRTQLPEFAIPAAFVMLDRLPLTPYGKLNTKALPAPPQPGRDSLTFVAPRTDRERQLAALWGEVLHVEDVGVCDDFFDLGGDSLAAAHLFVAIEKHFGVRLPMEVLFQAPTVAALAKALAEDAAPVAVQSLVPIQAAGNRPPFFCVHAVGGEVLAYKRLAECLGPDQPFFGLQAKGLYTNEEPLTSLEAMAQRYVEEMMARQPQGPYYLGGWSCGGAIAYEMAQQLRWRGQTVAFLAIIDQRRPNEGSGGTWTLASLLRSVGNLPYWLIEDCLRMRPSDLLRRVGVKMRALARRVATTVGSLGRRRAAADVSDVFDVTRIPDDHLKLLRAIFRAMRNYVPLPYPGKVHLYRARAQALLPGDWHRADMGWKGLAQGGLAITQVPGTHDSIVLGRQVETLARRLGADLAAAQADHAAMPCR